jgi:hypothetical protein
MQISKQAFLHAEQAFLYKIAYFSLFFRIFAHKYRKR